MLIQIQAVINIRFLMNRNNKIALFLLLVVGGLISLYMYKKYRVAPTIPLLAQEVFDDENAKVNLDSFKGKPLIISYYASWCGDCIKELKELNEVKEEHLKGITIICITDETQEKLISFKTKRNFPFQFYRINKSFDEIGIHSIPVTYLVNAKGEMVYNKVGALQWKDFSFMQHAKKMLE